MKTLSKITIGLVVCFTLMAFTKMVRMESKVVLESKRINEVTLPKVEITVTPPELKYKNHYQFLNAIGKRESGNRYDIVNTYGYMGRYQFGRSTLNGLGYKQVTNQQFLSTPAIQEEAMDKLLKHNHKKLRKQIAKYCGKTINGVYITESGILAAAHLAGQGNVKKFFKKGYEFKDGYGTKLTTYMTEFSGYNLNMY